jgi:hypothetical protein
MTVEAIDKEFARLINLRSLHKMILPKSATRKDLALLSGKIRRYRYAQKKGIVISTKIKVKILLMAGIKLDAKYYSIEDMIAFAKYFYMQSKTARKDPNYVLEKWEIVVN